MSKIGKNLKHSYVFGQIDKPILAKKIWIIGFFDERFLITNNSIELYNREYPMIVGLVSRIAGKTQRSLISTYVNRG